MLFTALVQYLGLSLAPIEQSITRIVNRLQSLLKKSRACYCADVYKHEDGVRGLCLVLGSAVGTC